MAKKHRHEDKHAHCEHCLHACDHCDVAYCCDCNREWGTCRLSHGPFYWPSYPRPYYWGTSDPILVSTTSALDLTGASPTVTRDDFAVAHAHGHEN